MSRSKLFAVIGILVALFLGYRMSRHEPAPIDITESNEEKSAPSRVISLPPTNQNVDSEKPSQEGIPSTNNDFNLCQASNAQEVWYRVGPDFDPHLDSRNYYWNAQDGRTLLIRQQRQSNNIAVMANWFNKDDGSETVPKELIRETKFMALQELIDFAGPAWMTLILEPLNPTMTEEVYLLEASGESVTQHNHIAVALHLKTKDGKIIDCPMKEPCKCL